MVELDIIYNIYSINTILSRRASVTVLLEIPCGCFDVIDYEVISGPL